MPKILIATNNLGKLREFQALLADLAAELVTPAGLGLVLEIEETGETYAENAGLKARAFAQASGLVSLADDSGLEVDALDGQPGLHSARFLPQPGATDADRRRALLARLSGYPRPWTARFRCVVGIAQPGLASNNPSAEPAVQFAEGVCPGEIIPEERGANGFGYDPIFLLAGSGHTMAQLAMQEKNCLSHRARAIRVARPALEQMLKHL